MNRVSARQLVTAAKLAGSYGGIKVSAVTNAGFLDTLHVLFDQDPGFSAVMKMFYCGPGTWVNASTWTTDSTGTLIGVDHIHICGTGNCQITITQTFTVNGYPVQIMSANGAITGSKNVITITLTNGQSSCPTIVITP
jgi:hypothetical protein